MPISFEERRRIAAKLCKLVDLRAAQLSEDAIIEAGVAFIMGDDLPDWFLDAGERMHKQLGKDQFVKDTRRK